MLDYGLRNSGLKVDELELLRARTSESVRATPYRIFSAVLIAATPPGLLWMLQATPITPEFVAYLTLSAILSILAIASHVAEFALDRRRMAYLNDLHDWQSTQETRTTAAFWTDGIRELALARLRAQGNANPDERQIARQRGHEFAREVATLIAARQWSAYLNQESGDYGVDVFACSPDRSIVIQCKHSLSDRPSPGHVRELLGTKGAFGADVGILASVFPPSESSENEFFIAQSGGTIVFWHLGHLLALAREVFRERTGRIPRADYDHEFIDENGLPHSWRGLSMII